MAGKARYPPILQSPANRSTGVHLFFRSMVGYLILQRADMPMCKRANERYELSRELILRINSYLTISHFLNLPLTGKVIQ